MKYNREKIETLDARQLIYVKFHDECYGTDKLVIDGKSYIERCKEYRPTKEQINEILKDYPDREVFLDCNKRGWAIIIKTESNKGLRSKDAWNKLEKLQ